MSELELNAGRLKYVGKDGIEARKELYLHLTGKPYDEDDFYDALYDYEYVIVNGNIYQGFFEERGANVDEGYAKVEVSKDGDIYFTTIHYNGGASFEEVIEGVLK